MRSDLAIEVLKFIVYWLFRRKYLGMLVRSGSEPRAISASNVQMQTI
jgi:hypothetical protein